MVKEIPSRDLQDNVSEQVRDLAQAIRGVSQTERIQLLSTLGLDDALVYDTVQGQPEERLRLLTEAGWTPSRFFEVYFSGKGSTEISTMYPRFHSVGHGGAFLESFLGRDFFEQNPEWYLRQVFAAHLDLNGLLTRECAPFFCYFSSASLADVINVAYPKKAKREEFKACLRAWGVQID